jgi:hypothetical protein
MRTIPVFLLVLQLATAGGVGATDIIEPDEIAPGTAGVCLTEMDGGELVEIPLTVIGSLGPTAPEREIVLVRLEDPRFENTGIIAGMSGSPVYVNGRLLGALAFGWSFSREPIGGVTPFSRMLQLKPGGVAEAQGTGSRPRFSELLSAGREQRLGDLLVDWLVPDQGRALDRLPLAVSMGGWWTPSGGGWLAESWQRLGWVGVQGGAAASGSAAGPLRPGAMVAGVMVDGDAVMAAGGTVTELRGDQVWAFGHPFLGAGGVSVPLARARVLAVLPSLASSFKFFEVGEIFGALLEDRSHGVWGEVGTSAPMVRVNVTVDGRGYSFRTIRHPLMQPLLTAYLTQASVSARGRTMGHQTVQLALEVQFNSGGRVRLRESYAGPDASAQAAAMTSAVLGYLQNSPFEGPDVAQVNVELATAERLETADIVEAVPDRYVVRPGDELQVRLTVRPHRGEQYVKHVAIRIPGEVPEGRLDLVVADGPSWTVYDLQMRPFRPASFADDLRLFDRLSPSNSVVLALERRQPGVAMDGGTLSVPPSLVVQLRTAIGPNLETTEYGVVGRIDEEMSSSVLGALRIPLTVREAR